MPKQATPSLDKFTQSHRSKTGFKSHIDTLPESVRTQLLESRANHAEAYRWLAAPVEEGGLGDERVTHQMVAQWRRRNGWKP